MIFRIAHPKRFLRKAFAVYLAVELDSEAMMGTLLAIFAILSGSDVLRLEKAKTDKNAAVEWWNRS